MAQIHNEIRKGWLSEAVNRALGRTREGGVERVSETCDIVLNPWGMPEWAFLRGEQLLGQAVTTAAVAAENGMVALVNPAGRNLIVTVEAAGVQSGSTAQLITLDVATDAVLSGFLAIANAGPTIGRDTRVRSPFGAFIRSGSEAATGAGVRIDALTNSTTATVNFTIALPVVLTPGFGLVMIGQTVNLAYTGIFAWRVRTAYPGEL